jgi:FixJ family two-component response regulator
MIAQTGAPGPGKPRVLIIDDDPAVRRSMQLLLQGQGFDVRSYASGEALLSEAGFGNPACLVADYRMEKLDGIALLSHLRGRGWLGPAVLVTGFPSGELSRRAVDSGYSVVFEKPLRERSLIEALWRLIQPTEQAANVSNIPTQGG